MISNIADGRKEFNNIRYRFNQEEADKVYAYVSGRFVNEHTLTVDRGCDPLTPDDVAEVIVFTAGRRENVVVADVLMFPSHQVSINSILAKVIWMNTYWKTRLLLVTCIEKSNRVFKTSKSRILVYCAYTATFEFNKPASSFRISEAN